MMVKKLYEYASLPILLLTPFFENLSLVFDWPGNPNFSSEFNASCPMDIIVPLLQNPILVFDVWCLMCGVWWHSTALPVFYQYIETAKISTP